MSFPDDREGERLKAEVQAYIDAGDALSKAIIRYAEQLEDERAATIVLTAAARHLECNGKLLHEVVRALVRPTA